MDQIPVEEELLHARKHCLDECAKTSAIVAPEIELLERQVERDHDDVTTTIAHFIFYNILQFTYKSYVFSEQHIQIRYETINMIYSHAMLYVPNTSMHVNRWNRLPPISKSTCCVGSGWRSFVSIHAHLWSDSQRHKKLTKRQNTIMSSNSHNYHYI